MEVPRQSQVHEAAPIYVMCPIDHAVSLISNKWTIPLLRELLDGPRRPSDLEKVLQGISAKTLAQRLHDLQRSGLVSRVSHAEVPPRVEYSLTPIGQELVKPLRALYQYGCDWLKTQDKQVSDKPFDF